MSDDIVPTSSTSVIGPLGIAHLPRLWQKLLLHACGRLPGGYRHGNGGFDALLCYRLGIEVPEMCAFVDREKPDYLAFEAWVETNARDLRPATVAALNARLRTGALPEAMAVERRARFGIADESVANAVALNDLDDWAGFHERLAGGRIPDASKPVG